MDEVTKDSRFSHIVKDPRFKKLPKKHVKVKIDKRFQSMFNEKKFQVKCNVDKRGRKVKLGASEDLKRYYELSGSDSGGDDDGDDDDDDDGGHNSENGKIEQEESDVNSSSEEEADDQQDESVIKTSKKDKKAITPEVKKKLKDLTIDYARGEGAIFSDSSSDEESSYSEEDVYEFNHDWGELDKDAETTENATKRLAVCNMNWDRIEAVDLMVLFNSFLPPGGLINSITIYPSEFGLQRMKEEDEKGPIELTQEANDGEEDERIQMEKLRKYQLNRLKYYYAVIDCDKPETADVLYKECDGLEYESSSSKLDLRFIPDDTVFDQEPRESCTSLPDLSAYKPKLFMTSALTKAKCDLTWDETDPNRENIVKSIHSGNIKEDNLKKYLACTSSSEESEDEASNEGPVVKENMKGLGDIEKYKILLAEVENKEKNSKKNEVNLEVSWNLKLENEANKMVKEASKEKEKKTPFEQYLEKRKKKKKEKQEQRKAQQNEEGKEEGDESAFSDDDIPSDIDMNDPYFKEEFESTKSKKPAKKKKQKDNSSDEESRQKKGELELLMLDNEPENIKHFSLKKIEESEKISKKKKLKLKKRKLEEINSFKDDFKIDVNDERFSALYTSHHFNIDPADPQFKPTKATKELIEEKLRRRELENGDVPSKKSKSEESSKNTPKNSELSALVKNIKKNTSEVWKKTRLK